MWSYFLIIFATSKFGLGKKYQDLTTSHAPQITVAQVLDNVQLSNIVYCRAFIQFVKFVRDNIPCEFRMHFNCRHHRCRVYM